MTAFSRFGTVVAALAVSACDHGAHAGGDAGPTPTNTQPTLEIPVPTIPSGSVPAPASVWFEPSDLTSSIGSTELIVGIHNLSTGDTITPSALEAQVGVVTWPEVKDVPVVKKTTDEKSPSEGRVVQVHITPTTALADRWYAFRVATMPSGLALEGGAYARKMPDGALVVRFRTGSDAVVSRIEGCDKGGGARSVGIHFSERVKGMGASKDLLTTDAMSAGSSVAGLPCKIASDPSSGLKVLDVICDPFTATEVRFALSDAFQSLSGVAAKGQTYVFKMDAWPGTSPGCFSFHP